MATDTVAARPLELGQPVRTTSRLRGGLVRAGYGLLGIALILGIWAYTSTNLVEPIVLPTPWRVAERMWELLTDGVVVPTFLSSLWRTLLGWWGALALGIPIGVLMGRYRYANALFHDLMYILANTPLVVFAVMALIVFGISNHGPAVVVASHVLPIVSLNVAAGVRSADEGLLSMSHAFRRSRGKVIRLVVLPAVIPFLMAGARSSFAGSWKLEALTETFAGTGGIGHEIRQAFQVYSVLDALSWMMFFVIFIIAIERLILAPLDKRIFRWRNPGMGEAS